MKKQRELTQRLAIGLLAGGLVVAGCTGTDPGQLLPGGGQAAQSAIEATATPIPTAPAAARPTYTVQRGTVQETLSFSGRWLPRDQFDLSFEIAGTVRSVNVQRNDTIARGALLADYQIQDLENQRASAQLTLDDAIRRLTDGGDTSEQSVTNALFNLANANLQLDQARNTLPWTSVQNAYNGILSAENELANATRDYNDAISRPDTPAATVNSAYQRMENARISLSNAQLQYQSAAQSYYSASVGLQQAENSVIQAEINLEDAQESGGNPELVQAVNQAQLNLDQVQEKIDQSSLYSPIDGQVLEVVISPGDVVQAFSTVMTIAIPEPKEVEASLAFNDTQRLAVGMIGVCNLINQPETAVGCVVRQVPLSNRDADQSVRVAASLDGIPSGQLIEVEIPLDVREGVLWLPPAAVRTFQNRRFVVLDTPDGQRVADVTLGLQTDDRVEIQSGIAEGDIVVGP
jgi:HlyD family secretion protein